MKKLLTKVFLSATLLLGCSTDGPYVAVAKESLPKTVMIRVNTVVEQVMYDVKKDVFVEETSTVSATIAGAGVFISPNGHILTCAHLLWVGKPKDVIVTDYSGYTYKADVIYKEDRLDLLLLKVETKGTFAEVADPRGLKIGQEVLSIGNPLGMEWSVTHGIISQLHVDGLGVYNMTQSDSFMNPGNSGGPLFNLKGELIGINSRIVPPVNAPVFTGLGFSVQSGQIFEFLTRFRGLEKIKEGSK